MARHRLEMALIGLLAGVSFYLFSDGIEQGWLTWWQMGLAVLVMVFATGLLAMTGPLALTRAAPNAAGVALVAAVLFTWAGFRFETPHQIFSGPIPGLSITLLALLLWPFLIARITADWRYYPTLFGEAWAMVIRGGVAWIFVGIVWGVILLSDAVLKLVGIEIIEQVLRLDGVPWLISGAVLGLGIAVVQELADRLTPWLVLRLMRLLLPVVLVVMAVFIGAVPLRGLKGLFGGVSPAAVLIGMTMVAAALVTAAVDEDDQRAAGAAWMRYAARALAALTPVPAGLAAWAIWLRVADHGWTPERLLAASLAVIALGYALSYVLAALRAGWMERIRQANIWMALAVMLLAALFLTPVLNPEAISARDQLARIEDGRTTAEDIELWKLQDWGRPGILALSRVKALAAAGNDVLAGKLAEIGDRGNGSIVAADLHDLVPLQPDTPEARGLRDRVIDTLEQYELRNLRRSCGLTLPQGGPGCVMVVADFLTNAPGDEAMLVQRQAADGMLLQGFVVQSGKVRQRSVSSYDGWVDDADGDALIAALQKGMLPVTPAPVNQLITPDGRGLVMWPCFGDC